MREIDRGEVSRREFLKLSGSTLGLLALAASCGVPALAGGERPAESTLLKTETPSATPKSELAAPEPEGKVVALPRLVEVDASNLDMFNPKFVTNVVGEYNELGLSQKVLRVWDDEKELEGWILLRYPEFLNKGQEVIQGKPFFEDGVVLYPKAGPNGEDVWYSFVSDRPRIASEESIPFVRVGVDPVASDRFPFGVIIDWLYEGYVGGVISPFYFTKGENTRVWVDWNTGELKESGEGGEKVIAKVLEHSFSKAIEGVRNVRAEDYSTEELELLAGGAHMVREYAPERFGLLEEEIKKIVKGQSGSYGNQRIVYPPVAPAVGKLKDKIIQAWATAVGIWGHELEHRLQEKKGELTCTDKAQAQKNELDAVSAAKELAIKMTPALSLENRWFAQEYIRMLDRFLSGEVKHKDCYVE